MKEEKLTGSGKAKLVVRYLRPVAWLFALGLLMSLFSQVFNALIPQIVRVTVDSVLGTEKPQLPAALAGALPIEALRADPAMALVWAAGAVVLFAVLRGLCHLRTEALPRQRLRGLCKGHTRRALCPHPAPALRLAHRASDRRDDPALHLRRGGRAHLRLQLSWSRSSARSSSSSLYLCVMFSHEREALPGRRWPSYPSWPAQLGPLLRAHRRALQGRRRGRGRAHHHGAGEPDRRARGARLRPGEL